MDRGCPRVSSTLLALFLFSTAPLSAQDRGGIFSPEDGELRVRCEAPALTLGLLVDERTSEAAGFAMGVGILQPHSENFGVHTVDEVSILLEGVGRFALGSDTAAVELGTSMHVPAGISHGFINDGDTPLRFAWVVVPGGLEETIRDTWDVPSSCDAGFDGGIPDRELLLSRKK